LLDATVDKIKPLIRSNRNWKNKFIMFELRKPDKKEKELFNIVIFKIFIIKNEENIIAILLSLVNDVLNERLEADCMFEDRLATKIMIISNNVIIV
jgi:hypothetical protein